MATGDRGARENHTVRLWLAGATAAALLVLFTPGCARTPNARPLNIVLISIDTLRADHLGAYGYRAGVSPFIDSVASRGVVFDDVTVPVPATDPSHAALFTALHPLRTGVLSNSMRLRPDVETLAEVLRGHGYRTAAATGVYHLSPRYGFAQGFDRFAAPAGKNEIRRSADAVNTDVLTLIRQRAGHPGDPFFLFVHYFDVHHPYVNHERKQGAPADPSECDTIESYDSGIQFVDRHVEAIWRALERANLAGNTVLAITADHGEQLGEHGVATGHMDIYRETTRVPLVLLAPGVAPRRVSDSVSSMDIAPTLLDLAGQRFAGTTEGRTLLPLLGDGSRQDDRQFVVVGYPQYARSVALRQGPTYYVRNFESVYRDIRTDPIVARRADDGRAAQSAIASGARVFTIPPIDFEPYRVAADVLGRAGCSFHLTISLPSGVTLADIPSIQGAIRLGYSVARFDASYITVSPAKCVDAVTWTFEKAAPGTSASLFEQPAGGSMVTSLLFDTLVPVRKRTATDELYNLRDDPMMTRNLIAIAAPTWIVRLRRSLAQAFEARGGAAPSPFALPPEDIERLRSLGYIR